MWVIIYFNKDEEMKVELLLKMKKLEGDPNYVLVDARKDNKTTASKIKR